MSLWRKDARRDANEGSIIKALEKAGALVYPIDDPADLLVDYALRWHLMEVKDGKKSPSRQKLTARQESFIAVCRARGTPVSVVRTPEDALQAIGAVR